MRVLLRKCRCGRYKAAGDRWRVLKRAEISEKSLLKCLQCGHRWHCRCKYVEKLADHTEKSRRGMTDEDILERIRDRSLIVDPNGTFVKSVRDSVETSLQIIERESNRGIYCFVSVCHKGKKKKISIHRLVWMAAFMRIVPDGFDVDHIKGRKIEQPDAIGNLRLLPSAVNRATNVGCRNEEEPF